MYLPLSPLTFPVFLSLPFPSLPFPPLLSLTNTHPARRRLRARPHVRHRPRRLNLGVIPGGGATQRLTHAVGKSRAMELVLTGRTFSAAEAERWGVVSRVVSEGEGVVVGEAVKMAGVIAGKGRVSVVAAKETVNAAYELSLNEGLRFERRTFHSLFATNDQKEGMCFQPKCRARILMAAFAEKRKANFTHT